MLTDDEIERMIEMAKSERIEISLFTGPRASYDIGGAAKAPMGAAIAYRIRGADDFFHAIEDIKRGIRLGIRSFLISDEGLLWVLNEMKRDGEIPKSIVLKVSISVGQANPASALLLQRIGASTFNISSDLTLPQLAAVRSAIGIPLDFYVTTPIGFGGFVRHFDAPEIVRVAAPVYLKFSIPLGQNVYPAGRHLLELLLKYAEEEVRQAKICFSMIKRAYPQAKISRKGARGIAIPV